MRKFSMVLLVAILTPLLICTVGFAEPTFKIAWSHYTGWEPWQLALEKGILKKWGDKYKIKIELQLINDYAESLNLYTSGAFAGCTMTNMDALISPAVGGVDSTALIVGDFSNGNDGIVLKKGKTVGDLKGRPINLVELSVSHYLLDRCLEMNGMTEKDVKLVNTSDAEIAGVFTSDANGAVVTWNPPLMQCRNAQGANLVFDSSKIPGEIIDLMVVRSDTPESLKKALVGAWYETMKLMAGRTKEGKEAIDFMAKFSGSTTAEFKAQLKTTRMFYDATEAAKFAEGEDVLKTMEYVRTFCFHHGLYGRGAKSKDDIGVEFASGKVLGSKDNVKLRFVSKYMKMAADGAL